MAEQREEYTLCLEDPKTRCWSVAVGKVTLIRMSAPGHLKPVGYVEVPRDCLPVEDESVCHGQNGHRAAK